MALFKKKKQEEEKSVKKQEKRVKQAYRVLVQPQITEKATILQDNNYYIFRVKRESTKPEIKKAINEVYNVSVLKVKTANVRRKKKRLGKTLGWKQGYKKAMVQLKKGDEIELMPR